MNIIPRTMKKSQLKVDKTVVDWAIEYLINRVNDCEYFVHEYETEEEYNAVAATVLIVSRWRYNQAIGNVIMASGRKLEAFNGIYSMLQEACKIARKENMEPPRNYRTMEPNKVSSSQYQRLKDHDGNLLLPIDSRFDWYELKEALENCLPELVQQKPKEFIPTVDILGRVKETGEEYSAEELELNRSIGDLWKFLSV
jgi:hypothetical protein